MLNGQPYQPHWGPLTNQWVRLEPADRTIFDSEAVITREALMQESAFLTALGADSSANAKLYAPHRVGETFQEWLDINQMNLNVLRRDKGTYKPVFEIQKKGKGTAWTENQFGRVFGFVFSNWQVVDIRPER